MLNCRARGNPPPTISWVRMDGKDIRICERGGSGKSVGGGGGSDSDGELDASGAGSDFKRLAGGRRRTGHNQKSKQCREGTTCVNDQLNYCRSSYFVVF